MRKAQKGGQAKTSLKDLLAQHPEPKRDDWANGRPNASRSRNGGDGFPDYNPKDFEPDSDEDEGRPGTGGKFAALMNLNGDARADDDEWEVVSAKNKKKTSAAAVAAGLSSTPVAAPASAGGSAAARRPVPTSNAAPAASRLPGSLAGLPIAARLAAQPGASGAGSSSGAGTSYQRAPCSTAGTGAGPVRALRPQTHDAEGRPISETYYQSFQKVYRNNSGSVCMRFHKTDIVTVRLNGDVVLTNGGFHTRTTFQSLQEGVKPLGLRMESSRGGDGNGDWYVVLSDGSRMDWEDEMVIPAKTAEERNRGERLFAVYNGGRTGAPAADPGPARPVLPTATAAAAGPPPPGPSAWSYRSASGAAAPSAHLRAPPHPSADAPTSSSAPPPVSAALPSLTPRTAASAGELVEVLNQALNLQGGPGDADADEDVTCIVCMTGPKNSLIIPCGHLVLCNKCAEDVVARSQECPMCRGQITEYVILGA